MRNVLKKKLGRPVGAISAAKRTAAQLMALEEKRTGKSLNPLLALLRAGGDESQPMPLRIQCWAEAVPYLYPKLQQKAVTVAGGDRPIGIAAADITSLIMRDPRAVQMAQELALMMARPDSAKALEAGPDTTDVIPLEQDASEEPAEPLIDLQRKDSRGHWR
jgi:hypothetical protein